MILIVHTFLIQVSLSLTGQTFIILSVLEPLYNDGLVPLLDSVSDEFDGSLSPIKDTLSSLLIGVPGEAT
jgi:hypothetical protein